MIRTLRTRLVAAAMLSLLVVLTVILGVILLGSYRGDCLRRGPYFGPAGRGGGDFSYPAGGFQLGGGGPPPPLPGAGV